MKNLTTFDDPLTPAIALREINLPSLRIALVDATTLQTAYLFGGTLGAADKAAQNLIQKIPNLRIVGVGDG